MSLCDLPVEIIERIFDEAIQPHKKHHRPSTFRFSSFGREKYYWPRTMPRSVSCLFPYFTLSKHIASILRHIALKRFIEDSGIVIYSQLSKSPKPLRVLMERARLESGMNSLECILPTIYKYAHVIRAQQDPEDFSDICMDMEKLASIGAKRNVKMTYFKETKRQHTFHLAMATMWSISGYRRVARKLLKKKSAYPFPGSLLKALKRRKKELAKMKKKANEILRKKEADSRQYQVTLRELRGKGNQGMRVATIWDYGIARVHSHSDQFGRVDMKRIVDKFFYDKTKNILVIPPVLLSFERHQFVSYCREKRRRYVHETVLNGSDYAIIVFKNHSAFQTYVNVILR